MTDTVRCRGCGKPTPPHAAACVHCQKTQHVVCRCGASHSIYAAACDACGRRYRPRRRRRGRSKRIVAVVIGVVVIGALGAATALIVRHDPDRVRRRTLHDVSQDMDARRWDDARVRLLAVLDDDGPSARILHLLAFVEHAAGNHAEAARRAREVLDRTPEHRGAGTLLVQALVAQGENDEAIALARERIAAGRDDASIHAALASALARSKTGTPEEIETHLREAAVRTEEPGAIHVQLGEWILSRGEAFPDVPLAPDAEAHVRTARRIVADRISKGAGLEAYRLAARMDHVLGDASELDALGAPVRDGRADTAYRLLLARIAARADDAEQAFRLTAGENEERATAEELVALHDVLITLGDHERARAVVERAAARFPDHPDVALLACSDALLRGDTEAAMAGLRRALAAAPGDPRLTTLMADTLISEDRRREAEALLRDAIDEDDHPLLRLRLASLLTRSTEMRESALAEAESLLASAHDAALLGPQAAALARTAEARVQLARGRAADALAALRQIGPDVLADPEIPALRARAHRELGAFSRAREETTRAIELAGRLPRLLVLRGRDALALGDTAAAIADARAALEGDSELVPARLLLARALLARGAPRDALAELARLPGDEAGGSEAALIRAAALTAGGDAEAAEAVLASAGSTATTPDEELRLGLARARSGGADVAAAECAFLEEFVARHPEHGAAALQLSRSLHRAGEFAGARAVLDEALVHRPTDPGLLLARWNLSLVATGGADAQPEVGARIASTLATAAAGTWQDLLVRGRSALRSDDVSRALELLRNAAAEAPAQPAVHAFRALAAHRAGASDEARTAAERALELGSDDDLPKSVLANIVLDDAAAELTAGRAGAALSSLSDAIGLDVVTDRGGMALTTWQAARRGDRRLLEQARAECERLLGQLADGETAERARITFALGNIARDLGDLDAFLEATAEHVRLAPEDVVAHKRQAAALHASERSGDALAALATARQRLGDAPELVAASIQIAGAQGLWPRARREAEAWATRDASSAAARVLLAWTLRSRTQLAGAEAALREARALEPGNVAAIRQLAGVQVARGALDDAIAEVTAAREHVDGPGRAMVAMLEAQLRFRKDRASPEAFAIVSALADDDGAPPAVRCTATTLTLDRLLRAKRYAAGAALADRAFAWISGDPSFGPEGPLAARAANLLTAAGIATEQSGARAESRRFYREAIARDARSGLAMSNLAEQLARSPNTADQAVELARRATEAVPEMPEYWDSLGTALLASGAPAGAVPAYEQAVALYEKRNAGAAASLTGLNDVTNARQTRLRLARARAEASH